MSKKRIVRISENELVELIDGIVAEAVEKSKKEWIAENKKSKTALLEEKIKKLEAKITKLTESK